MPEWRIPMRLQYPLLSTAERIQNGLTIAEERRLLKQVRAGRDVCWTDEGEAEPLVTVRIATFNRGRMVADRAIASALAQTYERLEILVIGDACDDATAAAVRSVKDPRVRFLNLPARGLYPPLPHQRRKVAGAHPMNVAVSLAAGDWIAPLDDDDEFTSDHVEVLLDEARSGRFEMVYSRSESERAPDQWEIHGVWPLTQGEISHGSVLYSAGLRFMRYSMTCWKRRQPADWNMWDRMQRIGVRIGFLEQVTFRHYLSNARRTRLGIESAD